MLNIKESAELIKNNWLSAWNNRAFMVNFISGIVLLAICMIVTSYFFNYIQDIKSGIVLNDWVLQKLPSIDVSTAIVALMGSAALLFSLRGIAYPNVAITLLFAMIIHLILRMITIYITGFFPPPGLIVLKDPMGSMLYQYRFITRDLFYSGHTAVLFLLYFCTFKKPDKYYMLFTAICVGCLLLVQHVHYTVDVACAPLFAFSSYWLSKKLISYRKAYVEGTRIKV
ncbi:MAG: phosphatase PAP2-related protein [Bacteroidia bacterium]